MRRVGRHLNGVLVPVMVVLRNKRRDFGLLNETLRRAASEVDDARDTRRGP